MKQASLSYHGTFPETPLSFWAGHARYAWIRAGTASGQKRKPQMVDHPFRRQRRLWCLLSVHLDGVDLVFATPRELDMLTQTLSRNPLPSGCSLDPRFRLGRPNNHWLSRLPAKAKSHKYREKLIAYLGGAAPVQEFLTFYDHPPLCYEYKGYFLTYPEAVEAAECID